MVFAGVIVPFQLEGHLIGVCVGFTIVVPFQLELHLIGVLGFFLCGPIPVTRVFIDKCTGFRV
jgi:hypothetical protein